MANNSCHSKWTCNTVYRAEHLGQTPVLRCGIAGAVHMDLLVLIQQGALKHQLRSKTCPHVGNVTADISGSASTILHK